MKRFLSNFLPIILLMLGSAVPAGAQTPAALPMGQTIRIDHRTQMTRVSSDRYANFRACYEIETTAGQVISFASSYRYRDNSGGVQRAWIRVTPAETCNPDNTQVPWVELAASEPKSFRAGGGPYRVVVDVGWAPADILLLVTASAADERPTAPTRRSLAEIARYNAEASLESASATVAVPSSDTAPPGQTFRDCVNCPEMVTIPAGSFLMGSTAAEAGRNPDEGPIHQVTFARPFAIGKFEVTHAEWAACVSAGECRSPMATGWGEGRRPIVNITWFDARTYVDWLSRQTGQRYFLPSEAEWEYTARAGTTTPWNTGDAIITDDANILGQFGQTVPVGGFPPNAFGLHDMHGNVAEWVLDCHDVGYFGVPTDGGANVSANCSSRVWRGGGFENPPERARSAYRGHWPPDGTSAEIGFRVARAL